MTDEEPDVVAEDQEDEEMGVLAFTCKDCKAEGLVVETFSTTTTEFMDTVPCNCGEAPEGLAVEYTSYSTTRCKQTALLDESHHWPDVDNTEELETETEEGEREVHCGKCLEAATEHDWNKTFEEPTEVDEGSYEFYVRCAGCSREIEFGWSHPDRGGRIWPSESKDFNPWKCWPEPRYRESWLKKDWIRPEARGEPIGTGS